jgi:hypothetical protein
MRRLLLAVGVALLAGGAVLAMTDGPLTPLMNLRTRTDANGYLITTIGTYTASDGPLTPMSNLKGRTDSNGYLITTINGAFSSLQTFLFGAATATVGGTLTTSTASTCTIADTNETDLWTYTLPANSLDANGRGVRVTTWGTFASTANTKTARLYFGSTVIGNTSVSASAPNNTSWMGTGMVLRTGAATQTAMSTVHVGGGAFLTNNNGGAITPAADTTATIVIKITGQNGTAAANDICVKGAVVETIK